MSEVLVVGGGSAGLTAALAAARRGLEVRLVEASSELGGMAASFAVAGLRVDHGSHRLHPAASPPVRALLDELLGSDLQWRQRNGRLRLGERWVGFPLRPLDLLASAPPAFAAAATRDLLARPLRTRRVDSYAEEVRVGLGPAALDAFHGPMATKLWGRPPDELSGELARKRVPVRSPGGLVRRLAAGARPGGRIFGYPRRGFGQIVDRLADEAVEAGVRIDLDTTVGRIDLDTTDPTSGPGGPRVVIGATAPRRFGRVLWTASPAALTRVLTGLPADLDPPPEPVAHRGLVLAYLAVPQPSWTCYDAHYVPDLDVAFSRVSEPRNYREAGGSDGDPPDRTVLCAEVPCTPGDEVWQADPAAVAQLVLAGVERLGLPVPAVSRTEVRRLPAVYPILAVDAGRRRSMAWADGLPGITVLGRQGRVVADNLHHVLDMALTAARCLGPDGRWDEATWQAATGRFETFTVED